MFFAPPWVPPEIRGTLTDTWLYGSDLYILVAGKMYPDPTPVKPRTLKIASNAVSTIIYDQTRSDLHKLFLLSMLLGMNYHVSVMPRDLPAPIESTSFKPEEMCLMFEAGAEWGRSGLKWRDSPPGAEPGEGALRGGTVLDGHWKVLASSGQDSERSHPAGDSEEIVGSGSQWLQ